MAPITPTADASDAPSSVLVKSSQILDTISQAGRGLRFKELQHATHLSNATLNRLLNHLSALRLLNYDDATSTYAVGTRLISWAHHALQEHPLRLAAADVLTSLRDQTEETVHLAVLEGVRLLYIDKRESTKSVRMYSSVGRTAPLHCTGVGKAILAFQPSDVVDTVIDHLDFTVFTPTTLRSPDELRRELQAIRARGYAFDLGEHEEDVRCVAAPILDQHGYSRGGLSITAPAYRIGNTFKTSWPDLVRGCAATIARSFAYVSSPGTGAHPTVSG